MSILELMSALQKRITGLENRLAIIAKTLEPLIMEQQAIQEAEDKIIISCDASLLEDGIASTGVVIRTFGNKPYEFRKIIPCKDSNEAELGAIYNGIDNFTLLFSNAKIKGKRPNIEIRSDNRTCIKLIRKNQDGPLKNKVELIQANIKGLESLLEVKVDVVWKKRNSTFDLKLAHNIASGE